MYFSSGGYGAPAGLTEKEEKLLDNLTVSSTGAYGLAGMQQQNALYIKKQEAEKYAAYERDRIAQEQRATAQAQAKASQTAAQQQIASANKMMDIYKQQQAQVRTDLGPWRQAGEQSLSDLQKSIKEGPGDYTKSPGYQFRLDEGQKAIENKASMHGNVLSGATMKAAARYGQDYATQDYDNFLNRYYKSLEPKQNLAGMGQSAAAQVASQGQQTANMMGQTQQYSGESQAGGTMNAANIMAAQQSAAADRDYAYAAWRTGREF